jgi:hypothetical protein
MLAGDVEGVEEFLKAHSNYGPLFCAWERIKNELLEAQATSTDSAMVPCQKCVHNSCGDGQCNDWPICTVVYDRFLPQHQ